MLKISPRLSRNIYNCSVFDTSCPKFHPDLFRFDDTCPCNMEPVRSPPKSDQESVPVPNFRRQLSQIFDFSMQDITNILAHSELTLRAATMLVTDVGNKMCWWQLWYKWMSPVIDEPPVYFLQNDCVFEDLYFYFTGPRSTPVSLINFFLVRDPLRSTFSKIELFWASLWNLFGSY